MNRHDNANPGSNRRSGAIPNPRTWSPRRHGTPAAARTTQFVAEQFEAGGFGVWLVPAADWPTALEPAGICPADWTGMVPYGFAPVFTDLTVGPQAHPSRFWPCDSEPSIGEQRYVAICDDIVEMTLVGAPGDVVDAYTEHWLVLLMVISEMDDRDALVRFPELVAALADHQGATRAGIVQRLMLRTLDLGLTSDVRCETGDEGGWHPTSGLAASVGFEAREVRNALVADRSSRQRRPGRDRRWRDASWIHDTEIAGTLDRHGAAYWATVRT